MKKNRPGRFIILIFIAITACSTDFEAYTESDPIPVVYAAINPADSIYNVRLTKSFVGPGNAYDYAKITDSIYYQNPRVWMETRTTQGNVLIQMAELTPTIIDDRDQGIFAETANRVYQVSAEVFSLHSQDIQAMGYPYDITLHFYADIPGLDEPVHAQSHIQDPPNITQPRFTFTKVYFYSEQPFYMEWISTTPGNVYEIEVKMHYKDIMQDEEIDREVAWILTGIQYNEISVPGGSRFFYSYYFRPENFFAQVGANIKADKNVVSRVVKSLDFTIIASDEHIKNYRDVFRISDDYRGTGYTNVENGLGIFTTYTTNGVYGLKLGYRELDSLANGSFTRHLGFLPWD